MAMAGTQCIDGNICVVAFLPVSQETLDWIFELKKVANTFKGHNVQIFWIEMGMNTDCEEALFIKDEGQPRVIAYESKEPVYRDLKEQLTAENMTDWIVKMLQQDIVMAAMQPEGGLKLLIDSLYV